MPSTDSIQKSLVVDAPQKRAFDVFTTNLRAWWPDEYHIGAAKFESAVIEPFEGGRWFERGDDGSECDWGRVLKWDPPNVLILSWQISADWQFDADLVTELEVRFVVESAQRTRVELEHRDLDRYGARADEMRSTFDHPQGWSGILERFAAVAQA